MLPREKMPYGMRDFVLRHEIGHNLNPDEVSEDIIDQMAADPTRNHYRSSLRVY